MLKKLLYVSLCICLCVFMLTGCGCKHEWNEATCTAPKTCNLCGETEGEVLAHNYGDWVDLDVENEERTCSVCDFYEVQAVDRKEKIISLLEGHWEEYGMVTSDGLIITFESLREAGAEGFEDGQITFDFDSQGNATYTLTETDSAFEMILDEISFFIGDGFVRYDFNVKIETEDLEYVDFGIGCLVLDETEAVLGYSVLGDYSLDYALFKKAS